MAKLTLEEILKRDQGYQAMAAAMKNAPSSQGSISAYNPGFGEKAANWFNDTFYGGGKMAYSPARRLETALEWSPPGIAFNSGQAIGEEMNKGDVGGVGREFAMAVVPGAKKGGKIIEGLAEGAGKSLTRKAAQTGKNLNVIPDIRNMVVEDATRVARREPHIIPAGANSPSAYLGAPRAIQNRGDILKMRRGLDKNLADDPRGGDWYDRYRGGVEEVTGGNKTDQDWMTAQHGQYSAGVSPEGELGFAIKDNNANLMGMPTKVARPAQAERARDAIEANDPELHQLGKKTGMYRKKVHPNAGNDRTATGVNDFRWAREFGYTDTSGSAQRDAMGDAQHKFMDYETALTVDRANKNSLDGRSNWTGEQIQAAPWVRQKTYALMAERRHVKGIQKELMAADPALTKKAAKEKANPMAVEAAMKEAEANPALYEQYFQEANKSVTEYFPKHTASATYETIPGGSTGHLPGMINATPEEKAAYTEATSWATAPGERDAIYAGLRRGDTGVAGRVRPSLEMQGMWTGEDGVTQYNPGQVARPLVGFNAGKDTKTLADADREMLEKGELVRSVFSGQDAGGANIAITGGKKGAMRSATADLNRKLTVDEIKKLKEVGSKQGLGDVVDRGDGITMTSFDPDKPMPEMKAKNLKSLNEAIKSVVPDAGQTKQAFVDGVYVPLMKEWKQGEGSGAVTKKMLDELKKNPVQYAVFNDNPYIADQALRLLAEDKKLAATKGGVRRDLQNLREVAGGKGGAKKGWLDRVDKAYQAGKISLPAFGAFMIAVKQGQQPDER
jgi:hypothetical protein